MSKKIYNLWDLLLLASHYSVSIVLRSLLTFLANMNKQIYSHKNIMNVP